MTRLVVMSDTHGQHFGLQAPDGDILIHCGDFCSHGQYFDALKFVNWFGAQSHKRKIFIAGNHDLYFEQGNPCDVDQFIKLLPPSVCYLNDSGVQIEGINFWGSPVQPTFFNWAFNRELGFPKELMF
jgi:predicted phosphodiesterase